MDGGVDQGPRFQGKGSGKGWLGGERLVGTLAWWTGGQGGGAGGRGTGPRNGLMPCGVGAVPTGAGLVDGGVDQRAWQERVVGAMARGGLGLGRLFQRSKSREGVREGLAWRSGRGGHRGTGPGRSKFRNVCRFCCF